MAYDDFTARMVRRVHELENALAEKDREIEGRRISSQDLSDALLSALQREKWESNKYHALMTQAVRFAEYLQETIDCSDVGGLGMYEQVQSLLTSPEVQAWRNQDGKP